MAEILALLGVRPLWQPEKRRVLGLEVDPAGRARPAADRRHRAHLRLLPRRLPAPRHLLDEAVALVAALDEPDEQNFVAQARAAPTTRDRARRGAAWRRATARIFGSKPGTYGAGHPAADRRSDWHDDADLAEVYDAWGGYAYSRGLRRRAGARGHAPAVRRASTSP